MILDPHNTAAIDSRLREANTALTAEFPGEAETRQPVHCFYGGAHLFRADVCGKMGRIAQRMLEEHGPLPGAGEAITRRVIDKLQTEPIEDYRIDFEDGYGYRLDSEEDAHAKAAAEETAKAQHSGLLPAFVGIRVKPVTEISRARSFRTLELFLTTLLERSGELPANFVVTLPKIISAEQPAALADSFDLLERSLPISSGTLKMELMVETPQCVMRLPELVRAARGRCRGAHFGAYDYLSEIGIAGPCQSLLHPDCDFVRSMMKANLSARGLFLCDGATNRMPAGDSASVHAAWQIHYQHVRHALLAGLYQGWDLHPGQLVARYMAVYSFFRDGLLDTCERLRHYRERQGLATLTGNTFDDAASVLGLERHLRRALHCGAVSSEECRTFGEKSGSIR